MAAVIISGSALTVALASERLVITNHEDGTKSTVPLCGIDRVLVYGTPPISTNVLVWMMDHGIPVLFATANGRWRGTLTGADEGDARRRQLQYVRAEDTEYGLSAARALVRAKLRNCHRVLQRVLHNRRLSAEDPRWGTVERLENTAELALSASSLNALRGIEGAGSSIYFELLAAAFPPAFPFLTRSRQPPRNAANALLSFGYSLLAGDVELAIRAHGLDPCLGSLHVVRTARPSLALDLMEPFRPAVVDLLVMDLVGHRVLDPVRHFEPADASGGVYLNREGRKLFCAAYGRRMTSSFVPQSGADRTDLRHRIDAQVVAYLALLEGGEPFACFSLP